MFSKSPLYLGNIWISMIKKIREIPTYGQNQRLSGICQQNKISCLVTHQLISACAHWTKLNTRYKIGTWKFILNFGSTFAIKGQNTRQSRFCRHIIRGHITDRHVISNNENTRTPASGIENGKKFVNVCWQKDIKGSRSFLKIKRVFEDECSTRETLMEASGTDNNTHFIAENYFMTKYSTFVITLLI